MKNIGILGSQDRFVAPMLYEGITRSNTSVFSADRQALFEDYDRSIFTISIAVYHAVSLASQRAIKDSGNNFFQFYSQNPNLLPAVFVLTGKTVDAIAVATSDVDHYLDIDIKDQVSFSYGKVGCFGEIKPYEIAKVITLDLSDIHKIGQERIPSRDESVRFFVKKGQIGKYPESLSSNFLPCDFIRSFCFRFSKNIYEEIKKIIK